MADEPAWMDIAQLVAEHHAAVYRYAYRLSGAVADAEDLTQQVFLTAHKKLAQVRKAESIRSWLFTILRRRFIRAVRQRRPIAAGTLQFNVENVPAAVPADETIDREMLQRALNELPPAYRVVLTMFYFEDCSYREISERLGMPMGTVMSRLARAKAHLRVALLGPDANEEDRPVPPQAPARG